jgi:hypothetical protein
MKPVLGHRGHLAIHCSIKALGKEYRSLADKYGITEKLEYGKIIVICDLVDCILMTDEFIKHQTQTELDFGDWCDGRYAWELKIVKILQEPVPTKGYQGLWNTDLFPNLEDKPKSEQISMNF